MSDETFTVLQEAILLAKNEQIRALPALRQRLVERGHSPAQIDAALIVWANHL